MSQKTSYDDLILQSLRRITQAIDLHSRKLASQFGLTGPQLVCLRVIKNQGPLTPSRLAQAVSLSQGTITGITDRLLSRELITRERNESDRRSVSIGITAKGREMVDRAPSPLQESFARKLQELPEENQMIIHATLQQIVRMMGAEKLEAAPILTLEALPEPAVSFEENHK